MTVMETSLVQEEAAQAFDVEVVAAQTEHQSSLQRAASAAWHFAKQCVSFLPTEAPHYMSEHSKNTEKRNDPSPRFSDPRG